MKLTAKMLQEKGACSKGVRAFKKRWPNGMPVNRKNLKSELVGFDPHSIAYKFFDGKALKVYYQTRVDGAADLIAACKEMGWIK